MTTSQPAGWTATELAQAVVRGQLELQSQIDALRQDLAKLRGTLEVQTNELALSQRRQREMAAGFAGELATFLVPLAQDVRISVDGGADYWLGRIHGTADARLLTDRRGVVEIPGLYLAQRTGAEPPPDASR